MKNFFTGKNQKKSGEKSFLKFLASKNLKKGKKGVLGRYRQPYRAAFPPSALPLRLPAAASAASPPGRRIPFPPPLAPPHHGAEESEEGVPWSRGRGMTL